MGSKGRGRRVRSCLCSASWLLLHPREGWPLVSKFPTFSLVTLIILIVEKNAPPVHMSGQPVATAVVGGGTDVPEGPPRPQFSEEDFKQLKEMFPNMDEEVVRSVYEAAGFSKDSAANALLQMIAD